MKRAHLVPAFIFWLSVLVPVEASAQLSVKILDAPANVYSHEPVFVVFEVRNEGREPALISEYGCNGQGTLLEIGRHGETLADRCRFNHHEAREHAWVLPGARRLYLDSVAPGGEGLYEIEAVVRSVGRCVGSLVGSVRLPLPSYREIEHVGHRFDCWAGEARSQRITVNVETPTSEVDLGAAAILNLEKSGNPPLTLLMNIKKLYEQFPTSHYTYAAMLGSSGALGVLNIAVQQPDNPLNRFAAGAMAAQVSKLTRPCADPRAFRDRSPEEWWQRYEAFLARHEPPQSIKDYLEQLQRDHAAEECPKREPEGGGSAAAGETPASVGTGAAPNASAETKPQPAAAPVRPSGTAPTSSMAFKQRVIIYSTLTEQIHWLSLPYRYTPPDAGTPGTLDAEDLCQDLGANRITAIIRWNEPTSTFVEHTCGAVSPFPLLRGIGYGVRIRANSGIDTSLSGGHDNAFTFAIPPSGGSQLSWISLPYHLKKTTATAGSMSAEDLCQQIGISEVRAIVRWDTATGLYHAYVCGSTFQTPFPIKRGTAYGVINKPGQTITWQPEHY